MGFCGKCGAKVSDGVAFCPNCGEAVGGSEKESADQNEFFAEDTKTQMQGKVIANIIRIMISAALLLFIIFTVKNVFFKKPYVKIIEKYYDALENQDVDKMYALFPPQYYDAMEEQMDYTEEDIREDFKDKLESELKSAENKYGDDVTYKVEEYTDIDKYDSDDIEEINKTLSEIGVKVSQVYKVAVKVKADGKTGDGEMDAEFTVIKVDGKWYMLG